MRYVSRNQTLGGEILLYDILYTTKKNQRHLENSSRLIQGLNETQGRREQALSEYLALLTSQQDQDREHTRSMCSDRDFTINTLSNDIMEITKEANENMRQSMQDTSWAFLCCTMSHALAVTISVLCMYRNET